MSTHPGGTPLLRGPALTRLAGRSVHTPGVWIGPTPKWVERSIGQPCGPPLVRVMGEQVQGGAGLTGTCVDGDSQCAGGALGKRIRNRHYSDECLDQRHVAGWMRLGKVHGLGLWNIGDRRCHQRRSPVVFGQRWGQVGLGGSAHRRDRDLAVVEQCADLSG